jgi:hypothetical protein
MGVIKGDPNRISRMKVVAKKNRVEFQRFRTSLSLCFVGQRPELSSFLREGVESLNNTLM